MWQILFYLHLALAASLSEVELCQKKPWLCEENKCPKNEQNIGDSCQCKPGFERDEKTNSCEPILE